MKLLYVEMENILSIKHIRLDFDGSGMILMDGWNYDDDSANGAGKSAAFIGIPFSIWDKIPRKITKSEILRKGTKKGYSKTGIQVGDDIYEVVRRRPSKVEFFKNGEEIEMSQEEFEKIIGLTYSQYLICMYTAQVSGKKLLDLNDTEKKDFILRLMDLEKFSMKKKEVDAILKDLYKRRTDGEMEITKYISKLAVYYEQAVETRSLEDKITQLDCSELEKKLAKYQAVQKPDVSKYVELRNKVSLKRGAMDIQRSTQIHVKAQLDSIKTELSNLEHSKIDCPECSAEIVRGSTVKDVRAKLEAKVQELTAQYNSFPNFKTAEVQLDQILEKAQIAQQRDEESYTAARLQIADISSKISMRKVKITSLQEQINAQATIQAQIKQLQSDKQRVADEMAVVNQDIEVWETVSMTLAPTGAPAYIMDAVIDVFNEKISDYISEIWPNASYRIQSFKENKKSKEVKAKFSDKLVIGGRDRSIGSLSGGEYKCLSIAVDFAIMDVIESMFGVFMSPIILDEPFEGLDASNRERAISLLERKSQSRQIWVIDHASEAKAMFSKIMRIEKRGGVSSLVI